MLIILAMGGAALVLRGPWKSEAPPPTPSTATAPAPPSPKPPPKQEAMRPSFDAVRVGPDGHAVLAGRAAPGAEVTIRDGEHVLGKVTADQNGEWVFLPDQALPPGTQQLSLSARTSPQGEPTQSEASVAVLVPERQPVPGAPSSSMAVLLPQGAQQPARALQGSVAPVSRHVALDIVQYDAAGGTTLSGRADRDVRVGISVDGRPVATATPDATGAWTVRLATGVPEGRYRLRLEADMPGGAPLGTVELALRRLSAQEVGGSGDYLAVVPGNSLWHLASRSLGDGSRYVEIYRANQPRIANPDRIYPGQIFAVPAKP